MKQEIKQEIEQTQGLAMPSTMKTANSAQNPGRQMPLWAFDLLLGVVVTLVIAIVISGHEGGRQGPDAIAYSFAAGFGALMLVRRRYPAGMLLATMFLLFAYYTLGYPVIGLAVPVAAALYSTAEAGRWVAAVIVSLIMIVVSSYFRILDGEPVAILFGHDLVSAVTLMAAAIALGDSTRSRRALRAEQEQTARLIEQDHAYRAEQRVQAERARMARDLHDVIGHSMSVISLHADVAKEAIGSDDNAARQALGHIRNAASTTMRELRATVKLLRNPDQEPLERAVASLAHLPALVASATAGGLLVDVGVEGDLATLPARVDMAAYRIIQESLTNVIRHAQATRVALTITMDGEQVCLRIVDNGATRVQTTGAGNGIAGMCERARLLGGALTAQPLPGGGFEVKAVLPMKDSE